MLYPTGCCADSCPTAKRLIVVARTIRTIDEFIAQTSLKVRSKHWLATLRMRTQHTRRLC
jgi:hypothetical protein